MFERAHHNRIARVLQSLNAALLQENRCYFGGGTAIALRYGEYRESVDIDFMCSDPDGFLVLRHLLDGRRDLAPIQLGGTAPWALEREMRADRDGIRSRVLVDGQSIKFEIVSEARIHFDQPTRKDVICGVLALTPLDMAASKLLANVDRGLDDGVFSRDLIDLAMMQPSRALLSKALAKAEQAYGPRVRDYLVRCAERFESRDGHAERCLEVMAMQVPKAVLWQSMRKLCKL